MVEKRGSVSSLKELQPIYSFRSSVQCLESYECVRARPVCKDEVALLLHVEHVEQSKQYAFQMTFRGKNVFRLEEQRHKFDPAPCSKNGQPQMQF